MHGAAFRGALMRGTALGGALMHGAAFWVMALCAATQSRAQIVSVTPPAPARDFGYFVGDMLTGTAMVKVAPGTMLDEATLPVVGPVAQSIDIRGVGVAHVGQIYTIRVTYQNFVVPDRVARVDVPAYTLGFSGAGQRFTATVPGFSFTASPFRNDLEPVLNASVLRPDPPIGGADARFGWQSLTAGAGLLLAAAGLFWWKAGGAAWRGGPALPFAGAARRIGALTRQGAAGSELEAALLLHRAFDATAGARVFADDLDGFLAQHRRFLGVREEVLAFFGASRAVFFGSGAGDVSLRTLEKLSRALMRAERGR